MLEERLNATCWILLLAGMTKSVSHLHVQLDATPGSTIGEFASVLKQLLSPVLLQNLENLEVECVDKDFDIEYCIEVFLQLPRLRGLELSYVPFDRSMDPDRWLGRCLSKDIKAISDLEELTLNGRCSTYFLGRLFRRFKALRSFTYRPFPEQNPSYRDLDRIWRSLALLKHSLERLHIEFPAPDGTYYYVWPRHMMQYPKLTDFCLVGRFVLDPSLSDGGPDHSYVPPNVQVLSFASHNATVRLIPPNRTNTTEDVSENISRFVQNLKELRLMLKRLTLTKGSGPEEQWYDLVMRMEKIGVELREWTEEEERMFTERRDAAFKAT